jgi:hypothetical protein
MDNTKKKKLGLKYKLDENKKGPKGMEGLVFPVYVQITYDRKVTNIKSNLFDFKSKEDFDKLEKSEEGKRELHLIEQAMELETNNFTDSINTAKGIGKKLSFYFTSVDEVYKEYGIKLLAGPLLHVRGIQGMTNEERNIINDLNEFIPFRKYLSEKGEFYPKVRKRPQVLITMIHGYLMNQRLKPEFETLRELTHSTTYYLEGYNCIMSFIQSDFLKNKKERLVIDWLRGDLKKKLNDYIESGTDEGRHCSNKSVAEIEVALMHSSNYLNIVKNK